MLCIEKSRVRQDPSEFANSPSARTFGRVNFGVASNVGCLCKGP